MLPKFFCSVTFLILLLLFHLSKDKLEFRNPTLDFPWTSLGRLRVNEGPTMSLWRPLWTSIFVQFSPKETSLGRPQDVSVPTGLGWAFLKISRLEGGLVGPRVISPEWDMLQIWNLVW